ncbi:hypothetical protein PsalN5692_02934 [Piscirickettsia salmonis]|nr:hypothetical protein [Piscirickettsia salmonis]QGP51451.1 hypothetical protein PsalN5692_02934 [Piscirickettsia salmonis]
MLSYFFIDYHNVLLPFSESDLGWLIKAFTSDDSKNKKDAAFNKLIQFVKSGKKPQLATIISENASDVKYTNMLNNVLNPPPNQQDEYSIERSKQIQDAKEREEERVNGWKSWRRKVLSSNDFLLGEDTYENTLNMLYRVLQQKKNSTEKWGYWDAQFVETAFSTKFLTAVRSKLSTIWQQADNKLYSERSEESKNNCSLSSLMSLFAVKCCSGTQNWAESLSHDEAVKAIRISIIELNGFASFLSELEKTHPKAVEEVFVSETQAQIDDLEESGKAPILHNVLYYGSPFIKNCAIQAIINKLDAINRAIKQGPHSNLKYAFELVAAHGSENFKKTLAEVIYDHFDNTPFTTEERSPWVALLAALDIEMAYKRIMLLTSDISSKDKSKGAIALFAAVFGSYHSSKQPMLDSIEPNRRLDVLRNLVIRSYQIVKPSNDNDHEGANYTPNTRDNAERARSILLESLSKINIPKTISVLYELSSRDEFSHLSSRLKQVAVEVAARLSEPEAMNITAFNKFDKELSYFPYDDSSLFKVLNDRLDDFEHQLLNDEHSIIDTLRKVENETELRRFISNWLNIKSRNAYSVTQEAVVVSERRTDIRLDSRSINKYASIELKLDDSRNKWSGSDLKAALVDQLVGRYLNHERCYVGCLLIAMRQARKWENPETSQRMSLQETVAWLQGIADKIMDDRPNLHLSVKGINYSKTANE